MIEAANTALKLNAGSGRAYSALALLEPPGCYVARAALLEKALAAAPNDSGIRGSVSAELFVVGRHRESLVLIGQVHDQNPLSQPAAYVCIAHRDKKKNRGADRSGCS